MSEEEIEIWEKLYKWAASGAESLFICPNHPDEKPRRQVGECGKMLGEGIRCEQSLVRHPEVGGLVATVRHLISLAAVHHRAKCEDILQATDEFLVNLAIALKEDANRNNGLSPDVVRDLVLRIRGIASRTD